MALRSCNGVTVVTHYFLAKHPRLNIVRDVKNGENSYGINIEKKCYKRYRGYKCYKCYKLQKACGG